MLQTILDVKDVIVLDKQQQQKIQGGYPFDSAYCNANPFHPCCQPWSAPPMCP